MIVRLANLRNIGQFDDAGFPDGTSLGKFSLIHGENGRGKTTVAAVLRSSNLNDPTLLMVRRRLGSSDLPRVVIDHSKGQSVFDGETWSNPIQEVRIFDDTFISENVCSGNEVLSSHRQHLHELIVGADGVNLMNESDVYKEKIDNMKLELQKLQNAIPFKLIGSYNVDEFCQLTEDRQIDKKIQEAEERLAAAQSKDEILSKPIFSKIELPDFDVAEINRVLSQSISEIDEKAARSVSEHISTIGEGGEAWVSDGMKRIDNASASTKKDICPMCTQDISHSEIIAHYRIHFSQAYENMKLEVSKFERGFLDTYGETGQSKFKSRYENALQTHEFWKKFTSLPPLEIDVQAIGNDWEITYHSVLISLQAKVAAPLENVKLNRDTMNLIKNYRKRIQEVKTVWKIFESQNISILEMKNNVDADDISQLKEKLNNLRAQKVRFDASMVAHCERYVSKKDEIRDAEKHREGVKAELKKYREVIFPKYRDSINNYLRVFSASFQLGEVTPQGTRGGPTLLYHVVINNKSVSLTSDDEPSFRSTLSAGDRSNLALAFFLASLDQDSELNKKIVVFDDPMTSLDAHRSSCTRQEIISLSGKVKQIIVLSHSIQFLCNLHVDLKKQQVEHSAFDIERDGTGSKFMVREVDLLCITEYDESHKMIRNYLRSGDSKRRREVASTLRILLESFLRVACPENFPPGAMLGRFITKCRNRLGKANPILSFDSIEELEKLVDYANQFHHDTNPNVNSVRINDGELTQFAKRILAFTSINDD